MMAKFNFMFDTATKEFSADFDGKVVDNLDVVNFSKFWSSDTDATPKGMLDVITREQQNDEKMTVQTHIMASESGTLIKTIHKDTIRKGIAKVLRASFQE